MSLSRQQLVVFELFPAIVKLARVISIRRRRADPQGYSFVQDSTRNAPSIDQIVQSTGNNANDTLVGLKPTAAASDTALTWI